MHTTKGTEMTTTTQDQLTDLTQRGQQVFTKAFEAWTETVQDYATNFGNGHYGLPTADHLVNDVFDLAEEVLRAQREVATSLLNAGSKVSEATKKVTDDVKAAGEKVSRRTATT